VHEFFCGPDVWWKDPLNYLVTILATFGGAFFAFRITEQAKNRDLFFAWIETFTTNINDFVETDERRLLNAPSSAYCGSENLRCIAEIRQNVRESVRSFNGNLSLKTDREKLRNILIEIIDASPG
jgi:hypothetical protein